MFRDFFKSATEKCAEPVEHVCAGVVAMLATKLGKRCSMNTSSSGDIVERDTTSCLKGQIGDALFQSESDHFNSLPMALLRPYCRVCATFDEKTLLSIISCV